MKANRTFKTILAVAFAAVCTNGVCQTAGNQPIIVPKDSAAAVNQPIIDDDNTIYTSVKIMPEFPGGESAFKKYIADNLQNFKSKKSISGKVFVQFVIGKDGMVEPESAAVTVGINDEIDAEVIRLLKSMPKWTPGMRFESKNGTVMKVLARVSKSIPIEVSVKGDEKEEEPIFLIVEHMPQFPGGDIALREYIRDNVVYPEEAKAKKIQGKVFVQFVIGTDGNVEPENVKIARGIDPLLDVEAIRVIKSLPTWEPGTQRGKPVRVSFTIPIDFSMY
ncbi:MAG: TonB family protein [Salinivirgaceae bacterium]|nr:TonB family protein [Salinivirgaceae bacterium]